MCAGVCLCVEVSMHVCMRACLCACLCVHFCACTCERVCGWSGRPGRVDWVLGRPRGRRTASPGGWVTSDRSSECPETGAWRPRRAGPGLAGWPGLRSSIGGSGPGCRTSSPVVRALAPEAGERLAFERGQSRREKDPSRAGGVTRTSPHVTPSACSCRFQSRAGGGGDDSSVTSAVPRVHLQRARRRRRRPRRPAAAERPSSTTVGEAGGLGTPGTVSALFLNALSRRRSCVTQFLNVFEFSCKISINLTHD